MKKVGLVLEGGGLRGVYTSAILDFFIDKNLFFPYVIGVSAGACNAISYISRQRGRNKEININYITDKRYISFSNLIRDKELFGTKFLFDDIPNRLCPFDYNNFYNAKETFVVCTTNCVTGKPMYFYKDNSKDFFEAVKASMSLPFISNIVEFRDNYLLDGGISDAIPIKKSIEDGNEKNVLILTRHKGYRKKPSKTTKLAKKIYAEYPNLIEAMANRHLMYNSTLDYIEQLEKEGKVFVVYPSKPIKVKRVEKNPKKLSALYEQGYNDIQNLYDSLIEWLNN
ncbi:MAG: patatin family protein [Epulopiscium sp.]|nr:patatin family protein [Candidatus Epulonipiscium sp.]